MIFIETDIASEMLGSIPFSGEYPNIGNPAPTQETYGDWQEAYDFFNKRLFKYRLPSCLITLARRPRTLGYFSGDAFKSIDGAVSHEISINPAHIESQGDAKALATLVHEMTHLWRWVFGPDNKKTPGYHCVSWADKMGEIGLLPTDTGLPDGKRTGYGISHLIVDEGPFDIACKELLEEGFVIKWHDREPPSTPEKDGDDSGSDEPKKKSKRAKFTCPDCELNAWAKPDARFTCGDCGVPMLAAE